MSDIFGEGPASPGGTNLPAVPQGTALANLTSGKNMTRALGRSLVELTAATLTKSITPPTPSSVQNAVMSPPLSLQALTTARQIMIAERQKPFLVYLILDLTASRDQTRAAMQAYEKRIAELLMQSGGNHPVLCIGIYYDGNGCSEPQILKNKTDVQNFFDTPPYAGSTSIHPALTHYINDLTDAVLSLAVVIGDTADGDKESALVKLVQKKQRDKPPRPVYFAYEQTGDGSSAEFCREETGIAHTVAAASGCFAESLTKSPTGLIGLLEGFKLTLTATPVQLREAVRPTAPGQTTIFDSLTSISASARKFLTDQAGQLLRLAGPGSGS